MAVSEPDGSGELGLEELYEQHGGALLRLCRRRLRDPSRAEDACHEALVRAHEAADRFRPGAPVWPWLATIAINVCADMERRDSRLAYMAEPPDVAASAEVGTEADRRTRRGIMRAAVASLPLPYRRSVFLHHFAGLSYDEIADHEGTSVGAIRSRLLRARRLLRVRVEELATRSGDWPLPAAAPWLRDRVAGARVVFGRVDAAIGQNAGSAAQYAAALLFAIGVGASGVAVGDSADQHAVPAAAAARAGAVRVPIGAPVLGQSVAADTQRVSDVARSVPPLPPPQHPPFIRPQTIQPPVPVYGSSEPIHLVSWQCGGPGKNEPGPVTKKLCETFPNGITPP